jgi:toxin YhaV
LITDELETLISTVETLKEKDPINYHRKNATKRLAAITKLMFDVVPQDPTKPEYRQGDTLGSDHKHWFRAKFFQQYRLFFRFDTSSKLLVFAWVNDEKHKRAYGSKSDTYRVFEKMLRSGNPPDDWDQLLKETEPNLERLQKTVNKLKK